MSCSVVVNTVPKDRFLCGVQNIGTKLWISKIVRQTVSSRWSKNSEWTLY